MRSYSVILTLPLLVAGAAGFYVALVRSVHPARRLLCWVLAPAVIDIFAVVELAFLQISTSPTSVKSVLEQSSKTVRWDAFVYTIKNLEPGFQVALAGLVLVTIFFVLLVRARTTTPIRLKTAAQSTEFSTDEMPNRDDRRTMIFVWTMICLVPLTLFVESLVMGRIEGLSVFIHVDSPVVDREIMLIDTLVSFLCLLALVLLAVGKEARTGVWRALRLAEVKYPILAVFFPVAVASVWPVLNYVHDRLLWASYQWGKFDPPSLASYFGLLTPLSLRFFLLALPEEMAWRGYLQPRFIGRYGVGRGIFLVGVVWGAFHFWGDAYGYRSSYLILNLGTRLASMIAVGYVLAWLTIKSRSILPAVIAHAVYNIMAIGRFVLVDNPWWLRILLWSALAYVVFRFDPPETETVTTKTQVAPELSDAKESGSAETA